MRKFQFAFAFFSVIGFSYAATAVTTSANTFSVNGYVSQNGTAVSGPSHSFVLYVQDSAGCAVYSESQTYSFSTAGYFSLTLGTGAVTALSGITNFTQLFDPTLNLTSGKLLPNLTTTCTPQTGSTANWSVAVNIDSNLLTGSVPITATPYAIIAQQAGQASSATSNGFSIPALGGGTGSYSIQVPAALTSSLTWTLPVSNSAGVLQNNGSGVLSWGASTAGTVTNVTASAPLSVTAGSTAPVVALTGTVPTANGGTGLTTVPGAGQFLGSLNGTSYAPMGVAVSTGLGIGITGSNIVLSNTGVLGLAATAPLSVNTSTGNVSLTLGTVPVANGGTGVNGSTVSANSVFAGPIGAAGPAAFRSLASTDLPSGTASVSGLAVGTVPYISATNTLSSSPVNVAGANVGFGTNAPAYPVHAVGSTASAIYATSAVPASFTGTVQGLNSGFGAGVSGSSSNGIGVVATSSAPASAAVYAYNSNGAGTASYGLFAQSTTSSSGYFLSTAGNTQPNLVSKGAAGGTGDLFQAQDATGASLFKVSSTGAVGIGTRGSASLGQISIQDPNGYFSTAGSVQNFISGVDQSGNSVWNVGIQPNTNNNLSIRSEPYTNTSGIEFWTFNANRMVIDGTGKVGIGTTAPTTVLDVAGGIRGRVYYPACAAGCAALSLAGIPALANTIFINSTGSVSLASTNPFSAATEGYSFDFIVCNTGASNLPVAFGGHASGFANGASWSNISPGQCTTEHFTVVNNGGYYAMPVGPASMYVP